MINNGYTTKDIKKHNSNWPKIPDHLYRILTIQGFGSTTINAF